MKYLQEEASQQRNFLRNVVFVGRKDPETAAFLIDNQKEINKILADKKLSGMPMRDLIEVLNKENYPKFLELAKNTELTGKNFAAPFIYGAKSHVVAFGNETVKVPSEAVVSLLSGVDSFSVMKTKSYDAFNEMVQRLVADGYKTGDPQYYQIAEGILTQKPELAKIADEYIKYSNSLQKAGIYNESEMIEELEGFFEYYRKYANLPQEIELKTIIPDENALNSTRMTLSVFKSKNGIK